MCLPLLNIVQHAVSVHSREDLEHVGKLLLLLLLLASREGSAAHRRLVKLEKLLRELMVPLCYQVMRDKRAGRTEAHERRSQLRPYRALTDLDQGHQQVV